jgi:hypothetical protein
MKYVYYTPNGRQDKLTQSAGNILHAIESIEFAIAPRLPVLGIERSQLNGATAPTLAAKLTPFEMVDASARRGEYVKKP